MRFKRALRNLGTLYFLVALVVLIRVLNKNFLTEANIMNIFRQISMMGIAAIGMTFIMIAGGVDLSVGSMGALAGVFAAKIMVAQNVHPVIAVLVTLALSAFVGFINGYISIKLDIHPLITTLGTYTILRGLAYILSQGRPIYGFPRSFNIIGGGYLWRIPVPVIIFFIFMLVAYVILQQTSTGRYLYAIGGNTEAARLSGIDVNRLKIAVFIMAAFLAGVSGIIMLSRLTSGQPAVLLGFELEVITACLLGGVSFQGGEGKLLGMLQGALIIGVLGNGLVLLNVDVYWQYVVNGSVLIAAVGFDKLSRKKEQRQLVGEIDVSSLEEKGDKPSGD